MGQELALPLEGGKMNVSKISELSTTPLWTLLVEDRDKTPNRSLQVAKEIAGNFKLRAMAESMNESLQALQRPIGRDRAGASAIYIAMQPLLIQFGMPKKAKEELTVWWGGYYDAFSQLPLEALEHAVSEYIRTSEIHMVPSPGPLTRLAQARATEIRVAAWRVKKALEMPPPRIEPTPEERQRIAAEFKEFARSFRGGPVMPADPARPRVSPHEAAEAIRRAL